MTLFKSAVVPRDGHRFRGFVATCGHCGVVGTVPTNTFKGSSGNTADEQEQKFVSRRLENLGWKIGTKPQQHRCPGCFSAIKISAVRKSERKMPDSKVEAVLAKFPTSSAGAQMSREDRRIIFEKLNEVYLDEKSGYSVDWTDAKVASDLGIARSWVAKVREEMFGPEAANDGIKKAVEEAKATLAECRKLAETFMPLLGRADKIEKTLVEIERALR